MNESIWQQSDSTTFQTKKKESKKKKMNTKKSNKMKEQNASGLSDSEEEFNFKKNR